jgi:hypothetical protein
VVRRLSLPCVLVFFVACRQPSRSRAQQCGRTVRVGDVQVLPGRAQLYALVAHGDLERSFLPVSCSSHDPHLVTVELWSPSKRLRLIAEHMLTWFAEIRMFSAKCPSLLTTFRKSVRFGRTMWI